MFLRAGIVSLAFLLASRVLGLLRESAQAAALGATGLADLAVLMLTLPDLLVALLAGGGMAYVLLPTWAAQSRPQVHASERRMVRALVIIGCAAALLLAAVHTLLVRWLAPGLPEPLSSPAGIALLWSSAAVPFALVAALWGARLQFERDFIGVYGANLVVNLAVIGTLIVLAHRASEPYQVVVMLGGGLMLGMAGRLAWLAWRKSAYRIEAAAAPADLPAFPVWAWAIASAGLPLALPFAARSLASAEGPGAMAIFNFAWKMAELPLVLLVQLVASLALGPVSEVLSRAPASEEAASTIRRAFALAWMLACACTAAILVAAPAVAQILFGWGRMRPDALAQVADLGRIAAWTLLPQALLAIALTVLAARKRMRAAVAGYAGALAILLACGPRDGASLMLWLNMIFVGVCAASMLAIGNSLRYWLPFPALAAGGGALLVVEGTLHLASRPVQPLAQLAAGAGAGLLVLCAAFVSSADVRASLRR